MTSSAENTFLQELDKKLWTSADRPRSSLDAAVYKHAVLGLICFKYVSDSLEMRQQEVLAQLKDKKSDYFLDPADYTKPGDYEVALTVELEERDYYTATNVFLVPALARWKTIQDSAKLPAGTGIEVRNGKVSKYKNTSLGKLNDDALVDVRALTVAGFTTSVEVPSSATAFSRPVDTMEQKARPAYSNDRSQHVL